MNVPHGMNLPQYQWSESNLNDYKLEMNWYMY